MNDRRDQTTIRVLYEDLLSIIAPHWKTDPHMKDTPRRVAKWWTEFLHYDAGTIDTVFPVEHVDQMVVVSGIDTWSLCAHHLLPFSATVTVGYIAQDHVLGLSKFARITHAQAHRPTSQESLVESIADEVTRVTGSPNVAVSASGLHLCMAMRGVRTPATMTTSVTRGAFRDKPETRSEWLAAVGRLSGSRS